MMLLVICPSILHQSKAIYICPCLWADGRDREERDNESDPVRTRKRRVWGQKRRSFAVEKADAGVG